MSIQSKYLAGISLTVMGAGFVGTLPFQGSLAGEIIQGGFEAGLVGGLADWFAVTALFRHPLGLRIPHTALLPKNRKRLTKGLINMLENEWLTKKSITAKLQQMHLAEKILNILEKEIYSDSFKTAIQAIVKQAILHINVQKTAIFAEKELKTYLYSVNTTPLFQSAIDQILTQGYDEKALDYFLLKVREWTEKDDSRKQLGTLAMRALNNIELDGFMQFALKSFMNIIDEEKLGSILQNFILKGLHSLHEADNGNRIALLRRIQTELTKLKDNEQLHTEIENWKKKLIDGWHGEEHLTSIIEELKQRTLAFVQKDDFVTLHILPFAASTLDKIKNNPTYMANFEKWIQRQIIHLVESNHSKIGKLVQENLDKYDDKALIAMMENNVGKDLQWIRVNGAVCGFIIGIVLEGFKMFI
ncbi:DUF445 domain-containing protein [Bacillus sp. 165]|uniref:DUF445 domain-containing protein n=1 Tax=Bacillus sp. 165 TaxID=1529117 RepID=UPI001ADB6E65|nr:DUF445 domain-containing protein [Bacillus sp. 165]MBO9130838.1 DUF445 domain-containing protein [Bacillus sp. 165]